MNDLGPSSCRASTYQAILAPSSNDYRPIEPTYWPPPDPVDQDHGMLFHQYTVDPHFSEPSLAQGLILDVSGSLTGLAQGCWDGQWVGYPSPQAPPSAFDQQNTWLDQQWDDISPPPTLFSPPYITPATHSIANSTDPDTCNQQAISPLDAISPRTFVSGYGSSQPSMSEEVAGLPSTSSSCHGISNIDESAFAQNPHQHQHQHSVARFTSAFSTAQQPATTLARAQRPVQPLQHSHLTQTRNEAVVSTSTSLQPVVSRTSISLPVSDSARHDHTPLSSSEPTDSGVVVGPAKRKEKKNNSSRVPTNQAPEARPLPPEPKPWLRKRRQRNQGAAVRYRARVTEQSSALEAMEMEARAQNEHLRVSLATLQEQILVLSSELLQQVSDPDCKCRSLQRYAHRRARARCREGGDDEEAGKERREDVDGDGEGYGAEGSYGGDAVGLQSPTGESGDKLPRRRSHSWTLNTTRKGVELEETTRVKKIKMTRKENLKPAAAALYGREEHFSHECLGPG